MQRLQRFFREFFSVLGQAHDAKTRIGNAIALAIAFGGPALANYALPEVAKASVMQWLPFVSVAILASLAGWAWACSRGAEIEMSDLVFDPFALELGVHLTNNGTSELNPRLALISITTADHERRRLLRQSRPIIWNGVQEREIPALPMHKQSAFVPVLKRSRYGPGAAVCVAPVGVEAGPPVPIDLLAYAPERIALLMTIGVDCGAGIDGNSVHQTYRLEPDSAGASYRITRHPRWLFWPDRKPVVLSTIAPITDRDNFAGKWRMIPEGREAEFFITLNLDGTAARSHPGRADVTGTWKIFEREARIVWNDNEWKDAIRPDGNGGFRKFAYSSKAKTFDDQENNSQPTVKTQEQVMNSAGF